MWNWVKLTVYVQVSATHVEYHMLCSSNDNTVHCSERTGIKWNHTLSTISFNSHQISLEFLTLYRECRLYSKATVQCASSENESAPKKIDAQRLQITSQIEDSQQTYNFQKSYYKTLCCMHNRQWHYTERLFTQHPKYKRTVSVCVAV